MSYAKTTLAALLGLSLVAGCSASFELGNPGNPGKPAGPSATAAESKPAKAATPTEHADAGAAE